MSDDETRKQVTGGGLDATQINVFIDGVSYKNDVLDGGVVGQDSSRGSPFPQTAVQEFQVLTQNYKAEHEKASSLVITRGDEERRQSVVGRRVSLLSEQEPGRKGVLRRQARRSEARPTSGSSLASRWAVRSSRTGCRCSGRTRRTGRTATSACSWVAPPHPPSLELPAIQKGTFVSPFREKLFFGKVTSQPRAGQALDVSYSFRNETDIRSFGDQTSFESAENVRNRVDSVLGRWLDAGGNVAERGDADVAAIELEPRTARTSATSASTIRG